MNKTKSHDQMSHSASSKRAFIAAEVTRWTGFLPMSFPHLARTAVLACAALLGLSELRAEAEVAAHQQTVASDTRTQWFREARFGMFIHWGLYSEAEGEFDGRPTPGAGEWMMADLRIPVSKYQAFVPQFNPVKFNAREWAQLAKAAGMKYMVITTKHHDGFALYPSALTDWDIGATPFKRDPLKELAAACKEEGITLCFYHSILDWHHPDYAPRPVWNDVATGEPDFEKYVAFMKGQLKELLTGYGPIGTLWFDGCWESSWTQARGRDLYAYVRSLQPDILINNRVGSTGGWEEWFHNPEKVGGDFGTPEQSIPVQGFGSNLLWEACMTMNHTWGFKRNDHDWKSTQTLVRNLIDCASKGGNYLLNVGPTGEGLIPQPSIERLREMGDWLKVNGESIYATTASPFPRQLPWGRCTKAVNGDRTALYLHVFDWPASGELLVPGLKNKVKSAKLLMGSRKLQSKSTGDGLELLVPQTAPNSISSTVVLEIEGVPDIAPFEIVQLNDGSIHLPASEAILHGKTFRYESGGPLDDIGFWTDPKDWAQWKFRVRRTGTFEVSAIIAAPASGRFNLAVGENTLSCDAPTTASFMDFQPVKLGTVEIKDSGVVTLSVRPDEAAWKPINLKSIRLSAAPANR